MRNLKILTTFPILCLLLFAGLAVADGHATGEDLRSSLRADGIPNIDLGEGEVAILGAAVTAKAESSASLETSFDEASQLAPFLRPGALDIGACIDRCEEEYEACTSNSRRCAWAFRQCLARCDGNPFSVAE